MQHRRLPRPPRGSRPPEASSPEGKALPPPRKGVREERARRVAARLLGRTDELRVVPSLIFALSDPDQSVRLYARDGLRFLSRKFDGFGMPDTPSVAELQTAQRKWRDWYRSVNPNYVFLDYDL